MPAVSSMLTIMAPREIVNRKRLRQLACNRL